MSSTPHESALHQAQSAVFDAIKVVADAPLYSFDEFQEVVYFGGVSVVESLAALIEVDHTPMPDEAYGLEGYEKATFRARVANKVLHATSESWQSSQTTPHRRVTLLATKRYIPLISWRPQEWEVQLRDTGDDILGPAYLDTARTIIGKGGKLSRPANTDFEERYYPPVDPTPLYLRPKPANLANVLRVSEYDSQIEHFRDNIVDLGLLLLAATGARVVIQKGPPHPELGVLRLVKPSE